MMLFLRCELLRSDICTSRIQAFIVDEATKVSSYIIDTPIKIIVA